jgi:OOP family OmpA-OmpF porin
MSEAGADTSDRLPEPEDARLSELRSLLIKPEQVKLEELDRRLTSPESLAQQVSGVLAHAVAMRGSPDDKLALVLRPIVEDAIRSSVQRNPQFFADILYPVMGPAIRKSIAEALRNMMESFNYSLETAFSWKYLKWRWEAIRTGRSFAEVVMLHTLVYRVEQLFLLHRESGVVLKHLTADGIVAQDADLVSGMLTAIQDFVHDSFGGGEGSLETFRVGELGVWIEQAPRTVLAAVVRGNPPPELSTLLRTQLELLELQYVVPLERFDGDTSGFENTTDLLRPGLISAQTGKRGPRSARQRGTGERALQPWFSAERLLLVVAVLAIVAIAVFAILALTSS